MLVIVDLERNMKILKAVIKDKRFVMLSAVYIVIMTILISLVVKLLR